MGQYILNTTKHPRGQVLGEMFYNYKTNYRTEKEPLFRWLGQPYFLDDEHEAVNNASATIAIAGTMRRNAENFMLVNLCK